MEKEKEKLIKIERAKIKEIARIMECSETAVYNALNYTTRNPRSNTIRAWAMQNGGKKFIEV